MPGDLHTMGDLEVLKYMASFGTGGVLAWGMFMYYRRDVKGDRDTLIRIVQDNTKALTELIVYLRNNGHEIHRS